jgi:hypothetical protein
MCGGLEGGIGSEYGDIIMVGIYLLHRQGYLQGVAKTVGFQGDYMEDFWEWMKKEGKEFGIIAENNWNKIWGRGRRG